MANTGKKKYTQLIEVRTDTGAPTGATKENNPSDPDYKPPVIDLEHCPPTELAWRGRESDSFCVKDGLDQNTGNRAYLTLEQYDTSTGIATGVTKLNQPNTTDYIPSFPDSTSCPITRTKAWRVKQDSAYCVQGVDPSAFKFTLNWNGPITYAKIIVYDMSDNEILSLSKDEVTPGVYSLTKSLLTAPPYKVNYRGTACSFCTVTCRFVEESVEFTNTYQVLGDRAVSTAPVVVSFFGGS